MKHLLALKCNSALYNFMVTQVYKQPHQGFKYVYMH